MQVALPAHGIKDNKSILNRARQLVDDTKMSIASGEDHRIKQLLAQVHEHNTLVVAPHPVASDFTATVALPTRWHLTSLPV